MIAIEDSVMVNRPSGEVFSFVSEPANDPKWQSDVLESRSTLEGPARAGGRIRTVVKFMGRRELDREVTRFEPDRLLEIRVHSGPPFGLRPIVTYQVEAADGGTRFTRTLQMEATGAGRIMEPMMRALAKRYNAQFLQRLKDVLEREPGPT